MENYKLNELKRLVRQTKAEEAWSEYLKRIDESPSLMVAPHLNEASINKNRYPFKAIYIFGPAGAGKSFLSGKIGIPTEGKYGFRTSNPDIEIEDVFPAFGISMQFVGDEEAKSDPTGEKRKELKKQQTVRNKLSNVVARKTADLTNIANPLLFDTTGENPEKMIPRIKNLIRLGYDVGIFMVNVPTDVSVERDKKRKRTVGEPTRIISTDYQKNVVQDKGYLNFAAEMKGKVTIFGGDIYPNLYKIPGGELLDGITQDHVDQIAPGFTPEDAERILAQARQDVAAFLTPEPKNDTGRKLLKAMRLMVDITGRYGQRLDDFAKLPEIAKKFPEVMEHDEILQAVKTTEELAGASGTIKRAIQGQDAEGNQIKNAPMQTQKGQKSVPNKSIRQMSGSDLGNRTKRDNLQWEKDLSLIHI